MLEMPEPSETNRFVEGVRKPHFRLTPGSGAEFGSSVLYMGSCQNKGPFLGLKRDHNFDNHPYGNVVPRFERRRLLLRILRRRLETIVAPNPKP